MIPKRSEKPVLQKDYSIGIVTYADRFESFFKPLIKNLTRLFPDTEIVIVLNGHYDQSTQVAYLKKAKFFLERYKNIHIISFDYAQSLSKLWNLIILKSRAQKVFILNDDLKISPLFRSELFKSGILNEEIALINRSWSHFLISKDIVKKVGWFDERFPAIGNEDEDYEARLAFKDIEIKSFKFRQVYNIVAIPKRYSYGRNMNLVNVKYIKENQEFFNSKWDVSKTHLKGYKYVKILDSYLKLRQGMDTPVFYEI